jgi:predicted dehydrogenase
LKFVKGTLAFFLDFLKWIGAKVVAVASRSIENAKDFAEKFGIPKKYGDIKDLLSDKEINHVYIASLNPYHKDHVRAALEGINLQIGIHYFKPEISKLARVSCAKSHLH